MRPFCASAARLAYPGPRLAPSVEKGWPAIPPGFVAAKLDGASASTYCRVKRRNQPLRGQLPEARRVREAPSFAIEDSPASSARRKGARSTRARRSAAIIDRRSATSEEQSMPRSIGEDPGRARRRQPASLPSRPVIFVVELGQGRSVRHNPARPRPRSGKRIVGALSGTAGNGMPEPMRPHHCVHSSVRRRQWSATSAGEGGSGWRTEAMIQRHVTRVVRGCRGRIAASTADQCSSATCATAMTAIPSPINANCLAVSSGSGRRCRLGIRSATAT